MSGAHERDALIAKQRAECHVRVRRRAIVNHRELRLAALEQGQGVDDETRDDVELDLGPQGPIGVHRRHEPIEAIVALHGDSQGPRMPLRQARDVASRLRDQGQYLPGERQEALADGGKAQRPDALLDQGRAIVTLQGFELVGERGLRQAEPLSRLRQAPALGKGQERLHVPEFQSRCGHHSSGGVKFGSAAAMARR